MKKIKYFMTCLLIFMLIFTVISPHQVNSAANTHTSAEAGEWARAKIGGNAVDWDGAYGVQCVDFILWYSKEFWGVSYASGGNANAYSWNTMPSGWTRIQYSSDFTAKPGDIAVWTFCDGSSYGHVGVVTSADSSGMTIAEQWSSTGIAASRSGKVQSRYFKYNDGKNTFYGVVRPTYSDAPAIAIDATISENSYVFRNGTVYLNSNQDNDGGAVDSVANNNAKAQRWNLRKSGNSYRITSENSLSGRVLNVYTEGASANGMNITLWAATGHPTQLWQFEKKGGGYRIHPSDNLNVSMAVVAGDEVKLENNSDGANQIWYMETPPQESITPAPSPVIAEPTPAPAPIIKDDGTVSADFENGTISAIMTNVGIKLDWTASGSSLGYRIYRSKLPGVEGMSISDFPIVSNEYVDVNVEPDTIYYYVIREVLADASFDPVTVAVTQEQLGNASDELKIETKEIITDPVPTKYFILMEIGKPTMKVNEEVVEIDPGNGTAPTIQNGRTLIPIRAIIETMGGKVGWNDTERKITLNANEHEVVMWLNQKNILVDGAASEMDVVPQIINGRTMLPIRFVADNIGCEINWIGSKKQVVIVFYKNQ